jgi:23S rRNA (adenine2503-C2)-methyltransferase
LFQKAGTRIPGAGRQDRVTAIVEFMQTSAVKINLLGLDLAALQTFFAQLGEKPFRAGQVMQWIHHFGATDFDAMTNLSKPLRLQRPPRSVCRRSPRPDGRGRYAQVVTDWPTVIASRPYSFLKTAAGCASSQVGCTLNYVLRHRPSGIQSQPRRA